MWLIFQGLEEHIALCILLCIFCIFIPASLFCANTHTHPWHFLTSFPLISRNTFHCYVLSLSLMLCLIKYDTTKWKVIRDNKMACFRYLYLWVCLYLLSVHRAYPRQTYRIMIYPVCQRIYIHRIPELFRLRETFKGHRVLLLAQRSKLVAQDLVYLRSEYLQRWQFHSLSGQLVAALWYTHTTLWTICS